ncbi:MAG: hypothetical protein OEV94_12080 [Deltaproteobacteria bacterium]|nr:hypothetical protein [Deltaproteobacteria bacterium]
MTPVSQAFQFDQESLITALIVASGIREGKWILGVVMEMFQLTRKDDRGHLIIGTSTWFKGLTLQRVSDNEKILSGTVVVDATLVNPQEDALSPSVRAN